MPILRSYERGEVLERSNRHAWKACRRLNRLEGSNPSLSAMIHESCAVHCLKGERMSALEVRAAVEIFSDRSWEALKARVRATKIR